MSPAEQYVAVDLLQWIHDVQMAGDDEEIPPLPFSARSDSLQTLANMTHRYQPVDLAVWTISTTRARPRFLNTVEAVSYTHLTLPTKA